MTFNNPLQSGTPTRDGASDVEAYLAGKAYIAVLKHRLTNGASDRTFRDIFDEAYRTASRGTKDLPAMSNAPPHDDSLDEQIEPLIAGKAYIAVLKHQLANGPSGKSAREIFEDAYRTAANMARPESKEK